MNISKKYNMKSRIFFILLLIIISGCQYKNQKYKAGDLPVIDISKNYPKKEIHLQDIADVEYVPLDTTVVLGMPTLRYVSDKYIVVFDNTQAEVFVFNRNGKILSHFSHRGQGGQEFIKISNLFFDEKNEEIFVSDFSVPRILVYSLTGEYKRTIKYSKDFVFLYAYNFDDSTMLVYDLAMDNKNYSHEPYKLMSKKDGSIVSDIDIRLPVRYTNRVVEEIEINGQKGTTAQYINTSNNLYYGQDFILSEISSDSIYRLTRSGELTPMLVRTPSVHSSQPPIVWCNIWMTNKFILLKKMALSLDASSDLLMYEFETGKTGKVSFVIDDLDGVSWYPDVGVVGVDIPKNMFAYICPIRDSKIYYTGKRLKGEMTPAEDENPIVAIVKLK